MFWWKTFIFCRLIQTWETYFQLLLLSPTRGIPTLGIFWFIPASSLRLEMIPRLGLTLVAFQDARYAGMSRRQPSSEDLKATLRSVVASLASQLMWCMPSSACFAVMRRGGCMLARPIGPLLHVQRSISVMPGWDTILRLGNISSDLGIVPTTFLWWYSGRTEMLGWGASLLRWTLHIS